MKTFALVCGMAVLVVCASVLAYGNQPQARPLDPLGYALLLAMAGSLLWLRTRPELTLAAAALATAGYFVLGYAYSLWPVPALVAVFTTISTGRRAVGWAGAGFLIAVPAAAVAFAPAADTLAALLIWSLLVLAVAQPAEVSRARRAYIAEVEWRALEAERTREEEALRRAQEERLKIAREMHDVTSHTVAVIALHAAVAAEAVDRAGGPPGARDALQIIRTASREALAEMKAVLGVLRPDALRPLPGSADLPELLEKATLPVTLDLTGDPRPLPPAVDLTVYRVVQEALTNTMRHAGAATASVRLGYENEAVLVRIDDDGAGSHAPRGHGLTGMAERVAAVGGRLTLGNRPDGGFQVVAWLPT